MIKHKAELLLLVILIPILIYVGWQAYRTYIKPPEMDVDGLENIQTEKRHAIRGDNSTARQNTQTRQKDREEPSPADTPIQPVKETIQTQAPEGQNKPAEAAEPLEAEKILTATGYTERDPLKHSLPVKEKIEELPASVSLYETIPQVKSGEKTEGPKKEIVLPTFQLIGIVWGSAPSAIMDNEIYKTGDIAKGAKIIEITEQGVHMQYEGKDFWVSM